MREMKYECMTFVKHKGKVKIIRITSMSPKKD